MEKVNSVFIATSIDGYIADKEGGIDWLNSIPNPDNNDMGYVDFTQSIDAIVMGRVTFETVCSFDIDWPYTKPVFVLSNSLNEVPESLNAKVFLLGGELDEVLDAIHNKGFYRLYIDGGSTIQNFLKADLIDEMHLTIIPILLGGGTLLFSNLNKEQRFDLVKSKTFLNQITQNYYKRVR